MGSVCCVSARDATTSEASNAEILRRTIQYSPSWGIRWDNRGRVAGEDTAAAVIVDRVRSNGRLESKSEPFFETSPEIQILEEDLEANPQISHLSRESVGMQSKAHISGSPEDQMIPLQMKARMEMPTNGVQTLSALPDMPSTSKLSTSPLSRKSHLAPGTSTPSKWSPRVRRSHLLRQGSDSLLWGPKSLSNLSASKGTLSSTFPVSSVESTRHSHGGSIDGWSVQSFPESTTSTHRETWSFDSNFLGSHRFKLAKSCSRKSDSHSNELETCALCSKCMDVYVLVAVLACGHVYHADCLEHLTPEISKYDPSCPVCTLGEKRAMKTMEKLLKQNEATNAKMFENLLNNGIDTKPKNKKQRNHVVNSDLMTLAHGSNPRLESSSSLRSSLAKPFLKRHFSFNSKANNPSSENHSFRNRSLLWSKSSK